MSSNGKRFGNRCKERQRKKSYVISPDRGGVETSQEVVIATDGSLSDADVMKTDLLSSILCELKKLNIMISEMTDLEIED